MKRMTAMLLAMQLFLCGCGTVQTQEVRDTKTICVVLKAMNSVHWMAVESGLEQAASDFGVSVNILYPQSESDCRAQKVMIEDAIASKPDAIAVAPCDVNEMDILQQADQNGVRAFYIDSSSAKYDCPYIGSDNYRIGELAAKKIASHLNTGRIAVISGSLQQSTHYERVQGFRDYMEQHTKLEVCAVQENPDSGEIESMKSMQRLLEEHPDVKGVFCTSAMMVLGAMRQRDAQERRDILLIGVDTQSDALLAVEQGEILAIVGQDGYQIGYKTIQTIADALDGKDIDDAVFVENDLITQDNVKKYLSQ